MSKTCRRAASESVSDEDGVPVVVSAQHHLHAVHSTYACVGLLETLQAFGWSKNSTLWRTQVVQNRFPSSIGFEFQVCVCNRLFDIFWH